MSNFKFHFDYIVIGSGPGGMVTGCLLAEQQKNVLILEKGHNILQNYQDPFNLLSLQKNYAYSGLNTTIGKRPVKLIEGECVGGGSEVNSGLYHRTPPHILLDWSKHKEIAGLCESETNAFFEENEKELSIQPFTPPFPTASQRLIDISQQNNWTVNEVLRWVEQSPIQSSLSFKRFSISQCYLDRFKKAGGQLNSGHSVTSIKKIGATWHIISTENLNQHTFTCKTLFICAGSLGTPFLLLKNQLLNQRRLPLYLHPMIKFITKFHEPIIETKPLVAMHQITEFLPKFNVGSSISSLPFLGLGLYHYPEALKSIYTLSPFLSSYYISVPTHIPASIITIPGLSFPIVRYSISKSDRFLFFQAINQIANAFLQNNTEAIYVDGRNLPILNSKTPHLESEKQLDFAEFSSVHLMGSCPMHSDPNNGFTNSFGKVYGHDNLYINDASLFCSSIGVNPQGTVMMLAKRNLYHFLNEL
ncbi:hypothetical protein DID74_01570 [Candidatus Marinamargulisbacteria bacterium SCGC AG-333-B06]|nr:hypothetical protein DID74_01570 [Candidatus Marinamargulisbacteria bacterium SCGC AG-333-B06]